MPGPPGPRGPHAIESAERANPVELAGVQAQAPRRCAGSLPRHRTVGVERELREELGFKPVFPRLADALAAGA
jgi:hypothetical protein